MRCFTAVLFTLAVMLPIAAGNAAVRPPAARGILPTDVDLGVSKTTPSNTTSAGALVTFNITVTNYGPGTAINATLNDTLPNGLTFAGIDASGAAGFTCSNQANVVTCTNPSFGADTPANFVLTATVDPQGAPGTTYTNVATVSSSSRDYNPENDSSAAAVTIPTPQADVAITKTGPAAAIPGGDVSYTITVKNIGPAAASDVVFTDTLPGTMTFRDLQPAQNNPAPPFNCTTPAVGSGGTITCTLASLAAGTTYGFTLIGTVPADTPPGTPFTNTADITTSTADPNSENNSSSTTVTSGSADISVVKSGPATVNAGSTIAWTITVTNGGPDFAVNASFTDALPAGTTFASLVQNSGPSPTTCSNPPVNSNGTVVCTWDALGVTSAQFTLTANVLGNAASPITNTAQVTSDTADPNPNNNSSTVVTTVTPIADVGVAKSGPATAVAGAPLTYTITVSNAGPSPAANVTLTDPIPANTTFVSLTQTSGPAFNCTTSGVNCTIASLAASSSATFTFIVASSPTATGNITNTATVGSSTSDPNSTNTSSTVVTTLSSSADVGVAKSGPATATAGTNLSYTITVSNAGPSTAANVTLTDAIPQNTTFVSLNQTSGPAFNCTTTNSVNCTIASLAPAASATFTFVVASSPGATGNVTNTASVTSATSDPNSANNNSSVVTTLSSSADVSVTKSGPAAAGTGSNVTYTITVANAGPSDATNVSMTDAVPINTTFVSMTQTSGPAFICNTVSGTTTCSIATLTRGASATFSLVAAVSPVAPNGPTTNTATVTSSTPDPNSGNNSSIVTTTISASVVDMAITKTATTQPPYGTGFPMTYTIVTTNNGPNTALGVTVTDVLPPGTTFVSASSTAGTCSGTTTVTCNVGTLAPAASATITLQLTLPQTAGPVTNTATVTSTSPDSNPANNSASATITVIPAAQAPALGTYGLALLAIALLAVSLARR